MGESSKWLESGRQFCQAGDLPRAEQAFRQALQADPAQAEVWHWLGQVCQRMGRDAEALASYREGLRLAPERAATHNSLGILLVRGRDLAAAAASFRQAVRLQPSFAQAHNNLGNVLKEQGDREAALACYREAVRLDADFADGHNNLALLLNELERFDEALDSFQHVTRLQPGNAEAHNRLGILQARRKERACAEKSFRRALEIRPDFVQAHSNLGNALKEQGDLEGAVACYRKAVRLAPDFAEGHNNLGLALADLGHVEGALACYARALELRPDYPEARRNRALVWLLLGDYEHGWPEYEWRWGCPELPARTINRPEWDGGPLNGRTILLHAEQGLGDTIHFVRYVPLVKARGGKVVLVSQPPLLRLLARCAGVDQLAAQGDPLPPFDVHAPLLSVPRLVGTAAHSIPAEVPYLRADPGLVDRWRQRLASLPGFKVGIAWQGNPKFRQDHCRSVPLEQFAPLARVPGVSLVSLQKGPGAEQLRQAPFAVVELDGLDEKSGPFMDTAAVMKCLDLVVAPDTALVHLAGALAVPCWVAVPAAPDWRWLLAREDSPWYPTLRLFRACRAADWGPVFERIARELRARVGAPPEPRSVTVAIAAGELVDKITILQIKAERISDPIKLGNVRAELAALCATRDRTQPTCAELSALTTDLRAVNEALWVIEDDIRQCERNQDFGARFVELARSVYFQNDRRAAIKRKINEMLGSSLIEEKSYAAYGK
jgi:tetratricopeptide (TPR) repeat protein